MNTLAPVTARMHRRRVELDEYARQIAPIGEHGRARPLIGQRPCGAIACRRCDTARPLDDDADKAERAIEWKERRIARAPAQRLRARIVGYWPADEDLLL